MESRSAAAAASRPNAPIWRLGLSDGLAGRRCPALREGSRRCFSACSSSNTDFENEHGYRTADEDADDDDDASSPAPLAAPPALSHPIARPRCNASGQDEEGGPDRHSSGEAKRGQQPRRVGHALDHGGGWVVELHRWSLPSSGSGATTRSQPQAQTKPRLRRRRKRAWRPRAPLAKADELYSRHEYEATRCSPAASRRSRSSGAAGCLRTRRGRQAGRRRRSRRQLLYEGLEHVSAALNKRGRQGECVCAQVVCDRRFADELVRGHQGHHHPVSDCQGTLRRRRSQSDGRDDSARARCGIGVASLSWAMRKIAAAVFASPPNATYDEALAHFQLAEGIAPGFYIRNRLMIAKASPLRDKQRAKVGAARDGAADPEPVRRQEGGRRGQADARSL